MERHIKIKYKAKMEERESMKNYEKYIKALLLIANQKGIDVNYETKSNYSEQYDCIITTCYLKFWYKTINIDKKTGEKKEKRYCETETFGGIYKQVQIINYLKACIEHKEKDIG